MNEKYMEALAQYDMTTDYVRKGRSGWICETSLGTALLKEYRGTLKRLEFETGVLGQVREQGFAGVDDYIRTSQGELISLGDDGTRYVLKHWYTDRECNLKDRKEILQVIRQTARLHGILRKIPVREEWNLGSIRVETLEQEMERHNRELKRARNFIKNKRKKTEFELCVMGSYRLFYEQAIEACQGMLQLHQSENQAPSFLCHGNLDHHHVLITGDGVAVIEFHKMHLGDQMSDLYHFMRKVMEKQEWDCGLGMEMLDAYDRILPLKERERDSLYYLFLYPEKYWKQINFYFNANKAWLPARNTEKIKSLERQMESRIRFLSKIKS